ncbi:MAG TPA: protein kinase [Bacteroidota bacterium]|nr:protein kinase [Bacteroidota bacterium]
MDPLVGQKVSHYIIRERLGEGGMGIVYRAEDELLRRTVALKFLPPLLESDPSLNARFLHEAQAASALDHPNICTIHEIGLTDDGRTFICMAFYAGETLRKKIGRGPLKIPEALDIAMQVARGLEKAHERGIVHRDIKPANILITGDGTAKIIDFGLAKLSDRTALTREGVTLGTVYYMSPEQVRGERVDGRTDIWSLGVVLYEMVVGHRPFEGEEEHAVLDSILNAAPDPVTARRTGVPGDLERIIYKCVEKKPADRFQHAGEFIVDVRHVLKAAYPAAPIAGKIPGREKKPPPGKRWILFPASALVTALLLYGAYRLFTTPGRDSAASMRQKSIAVLPFSSISKSPDDEIFADGIHDDILAQLSKIRDMRVIGRTSMVQYKDTRKRLRDIGKELEAGYILEGAVRHSSHTIRITAQLIEAETEGDLWADNYDRGFADVFAVQSEIARKIAASLRSILSPQEESALETRLTLNEQAYGYYLKGNYYWYNSTTTEGNKRAADFFQMATELDPGFAVAFACVSKANSGLYYTGQDRSPERRLKSERALATASGLGPDLPEVHHARGLYFAELQNDPVSALNEYRLALDKKPGDAEVMFDCAYSYVRERNLDQALEWLTRGVNHEPMAVFSGTHPLVINAVLRNWDEALRLTDIYISSQPRDPEGYYQKSYILIDGFGDFEKARGVLEDESKYSTAEIRGSRVLAWPRWRIEYLARNFDRALACLDSDTSEPYLLERGIALFFLGRKEEARGWFVKARTESEGLLKADASNSSAYRGLGTSLAWLGRKKEAFAALEKSLALTPERTDQWLLRERREELLAGAFAVTGETGRAVDQVTRLMRKPSFLSAWKLRLDPIYDQIRSDPRIQALLQEAH